MNVVYWDIDGTLLTTCRQGIRAWESALRDVLGTPLDMHDYDSAGKPDRAIARELIHLCGVEAVPSIESQLIDAYVEALPGAIDPSIGGALPNVLPTLQHLDAIDGWTSSLVTGNMREAAATKLAAYGLAQFFTLGGFGDDGYDRPAIATAARARLRKLAPHDLQREVLVGDTPHDIACGVDVGMPTLAVATGPFPLDQLLACHPSLALAQLPDSNHFTALVMELAH